METRPAFPQDTVTGGCFLTGEYKVADGEQIIDLNRNLDSLPAWGRLCIHPVAVRNMLAVLGWTWYETPQSDKVATLQRKVEDQRNEIMALEARLSEIRQAIEAT